MSPSCALNSPAKLLWCVCFVNGVMSNTSELLWWRCKQSGASGMRGGRAKIGVCAEKSLPACLSARLMTGRWVTKRRRQGQNISAERLWLHCLLKDRWKHPSVSSTTKRVNVSAEQTEEEPLNHTYHNTAFFLLVLAWPIVGALQSALCLLKILIFFSLSQQHSQLF